MKIFSNISLLILILLLSACSAKKDIYTQEKKPLTSDHHLMLSLLNRAVPEDQKMMLAFAKQRESYSNELFVNYVQIRGDKSLDKAPRAQHLYSTLIEQDVNAITITAAE